MMNNFLQGLAAALLLVGLGATPSFAQECTAGATQTCTAHDVKAKAATVAVKTDEGSCCASKAKAATVLSLIHI